MPSASASARASFRSMWSALEPVGRDPVTGGYRRLAWTREDHDVREWFTGEALARGLDVTVDRNGNQWAWWGDPDQARAAGKSGVVLGSHLDSVADGGAFDGPLGVVSAFAAVDELRARGVTPARPVGLVSFADDEGTRFGEPCAGSRLMTGLLPVAEARALADGCGRSLPDAMRGAGHDPSHLGRDEETLARIGHFVELHVEQGRYLATLPTPTPLALGRNIWPHGRWRIDVPGEANHAGTTRLDDRDDAMLGAAAAVIAARRLAQQHGCVATVGTMQVAPGGANAIPSEVTAWLDARGESPQSVRALVAELAEVMADFGAVVTEECWTPSTDFCPDLSERVAGLFDGIPVIGTGAGHDAGILAQAGLSSAMLFVRNPTGVSHSPMEFAEEADCLAGVGALADITASLVAEPAVA